MPSSHLQFTLSPGAWLAMDLWQNGSEHPSPIRVEKVTPLSTGRGELELSFYHALYPEGVKDKVYRLKILHRGEYDLLAVRIDTPDRPTLRLSRISSHWLSRLEGTPALNAIATGNEAELVAKLDLLKSGAESHDPPVPFFLPWEIEKTMMNCALRFDGYAWLAADQPNRSDNILAPANKRLLRDLSFDVDIEVNFAMFFMLQRFLGKWGGEMLLPSDRHHTAYRLLFLHLHSHPTPERWIFPEYESAWQGTPPERISPHAAAVRKMLLAVSLKRGFDEPPSHELQRS